MVEGPPVGKALLTDALEADVVENKLKADVEDVLAGARRSVEEAGARGVTDGNVPPPPTLLNAPPPA